MASDKIDIWNLALGNIGSTKRVQDESDDSPEAAACNDWWPIVLRKALEAYHWPWATKEQPLSEIGEQTTTIEYADLTDYETIVVPYWFAHTGQLEVVHISAAGAETELEPVDGYVVDEVPDGASQTITLVDALAAGESLRITVTVSRVGWEHIYALPADCVMPIGLLRGDTRFALTPADLRELYDIKPNDKGDGYILCSNLQVGEIDALEYVALFDNVQMMSASFVEALAAGLAAPLARAIKKDKRAGDEWEMAFLEHFLPAAAAFEQNKGNDGATSATAALTPSIVARG